MLLKILLIVFFALIVVITLFQAKYGNKFKLIYLFGKKGSGKSTLLCKYMYKYAKKGYTVYTNMIDCVYPEARIIDINDIGDFVPEPYSILCLDEVGIDYDARKFKTFKDSTRDFYKLQRHYKVVCVLASQTWDVDKKIRDLCDLFYLVIAIGPLSIGKQIRRKTVLTESTSEAESRISDNLKFTFPFNWEFTWLPAWQKYFNSFTAPVKPYLQYHENDTVYRVVPRRKVGNKYTSKYKIIKVKPPVIEQNKN